MPKHINLAELRAARKMEPKVVDLDGEELSLPADIPVDVVVAVMDGEYVRAFETVFGPNWRVDVRRFGLTIGDLFDIVKTEYLPDFARLGESLASAAPSNGTVKP